MVATAGQLSPYLQPVQFGLLGDLGSTRVELGLQGGIVQFARQGQLRPAVRLRSRHARTVVLPIFRLIAISPRLRPSACSLSTSPVRRIDNLLRGIWSCLPRNGYFAVEARYPSDLDDVPAAPPRGFSSGFPAGRFNPCAFERNDRALPPKRSCAFRRNRRALSPVLDRCVFWGMLVDRELHNRENRRLHRYLKVARLRSPASVEDLDFRRPRGFERAVMLSPAESQWVEAQLVPPASARPSSPVRWPRRPSARATPRSTCVRRTCSAILPWPVPMAGCRV
jgi:hypothetical protein